MPVAVELEVAGVRCWVGLPLREVGVLAVARAVGRWLEQGAEENDRRTWEAIQARWLG